MAQKIWAELYNQETSLGATLAFETPSVNWDSFLGVIEVKNATGDSVTLSAILDDGSVLALSSVPTPAVGTHLRLSIGKDVETDSWGGAVDQSPVFSKYRWSVDAGATGTIRLRVYGVKGD